MASDDAEPQSQPQPQPLEPSGKKPPGTWTPIETLHLIDAYQEKWYALKRGQLRTRHWDEVAESLAARCAGHPDASDKSSVQCRHKLEKLRRRYRAERQIYLREGPGSSQWPFFDRMDLMERGPAAAVPVMGIRNALPFPDLEFQKRIGASKEFQDHESTLSPDEDAEDSDQPPPKVFPNRKRSHHYHHQSRGSYDDNDGSYSSLNRKQGVYDTPKGFSLKDDYRTSYISEKPSSSLGKNPESAPFSELVSLIGSLGEAFLRMEQMKIQMQRETERFRADMELRRTEMVLECQKQIADLFTKALYSNKKRISEMYFKLSDSVKLGYLYICSDLSYMAPAATSRNSCAFRFCVPWLSGVAPAMNASFVGPAIVASCILFSGTCSNWLLKLSSGSGQLTFKTSSCGLILAVCYFKTLQRKLFITT